MGDAETYTSDSTGMVSAGFKRDFILVARVEDND